MRVKAKRALLLARLRTNFNPFIAEWRKVQLICQVIFGIFLRHGDAIVKLSRVRT
jgi:hypothetical protein